MKIINFFSVTVRDYINVEPLSRIALLRLVLLRSHVFYIVIVIAQLAHDVDNIESILSQRHDIASTLI